MRTIRSGLGTTLLLVALAGTASAQSAPPADVFAGRLPEAVAGEPLYRVPADWEGDLREGMIDSLSSGSAAALLARAGIDLTTVPYAGVVDIDWQRMLDALEAGTLTEAERAAAESWGTTDALIVSALYLGDGVPDELLDALVTADPGGIASDVSTDGRRIVEFASPEDGASGWFALVGVDDMLYGIFSMDDAPTMPEAVVAIPVPEG